MGAKNQKYFILYLLYVHFGEVFSILLGCSYLYQRRGIIMENTFPVYFREIEPLNHYLPLWFQNHIFVPLFDSSILLEVLTIIEVFFSLLFSVFVLFLLYDQFNTIRYDLTYVEYLKSYRVHTMEVHISITTDS